MRSKTNYKDKEVVDSQGKVKFSVLKKKGKHKRGQRNSVNK
jgi:hypothetical protein